MKVYMAVTSDEFEWPIEIADTKQDLSLKLGKYKSWAYKNLERQKKLKKKTRDMRVVEVEI